MRNFTVSGYLIGVNDHRLILKVVDRDQERVEMLKILHKKSDQTGHFITINSKGAVYKINNLEWKDPKDLIGIELTVQCTTRTYENFRKKIGAIARRTKTTHDNYIPESVPITLVSFVAKVITNTLS